MSNNSEKRGSTVAYVRAFDNNTIGAKIIYCVVSMNFLDVCTDLHL